MSPKRLVILLLLVVLCGGLAWAWPTIPDSKSDASQAVVEANTAFALDLYAKLRSNDGNVFVSPYSISCALAMTYGGARAETERQMANVLHFSGQEQQHADFEGLAASLNLTGGDPSFDLHAASAMWGQRGLPVLESFLSLVKKHYGGAFQVVDFAGATRQAAQTINAWVSDETHQKIEELLRPSDLSSAVELVLTNAVYFKGNWASKFNPRYTKDAPFRVSETEQIGVPMMYQTSRLPYAAVDGLEILTLPYVGDRLSMVILLPKAADGLATVEESLNPTNLSRWLGALKAETLNISLPRFSLTRRFDLAETLSAMGMPNAFDAAKADFSGITERSGLFIFKVIHAAQLEVNEDGSQASTGTAVTMGRGGARPSSFIADHPFMFLIRDDQTGTILFIGRVANPTSPS